MVAGVGFDGQMVRPVGSALTEIEKARLTWSEPACTWTVKVDVPADVGVPEIAPEVGLRLRPAGNAPLVTSQV